MFQLVYVSSANKDFSDNELRDLLDQARERNKRRSVTGMLLYAGGNFIQVLEGSKEDVMAIYQSVEKDPRNSGNIVYEQREVPERMFSGWWMGYRKLSEQGSNLEGYTDFLNKDLSHEEFAKQERQPALIRCSVQSCSYTNEGLRPS